VRRPAVSRLSLPTLLSGLPGCFARVVGSQRARADYSHPGERSRAEAADVTACFGRLKITLIEGDSRLPPTFAVRLPASRRWFRRPFSMPIREYG
jgi:hypothetical protein